MARRWRLFHPGMPARAGSDLLLSPEESHHVRRVLRLRVGQAVSVFDGRGLEWQAELSRIEGEEVHLLLTQPSSEFPEPAVRLELHQGLCRADRMDWIVQKGTELGLAALYTHPTTRAELKEVGARRLERWRRIAIEAAKQSGRSVIPDLVEAGSALPAVDDDVPSWIAVLDQHAPGLAQECAGLGSLPLARIAIGPESGFDPAEVAAARAGGWRPVSLGPRTLRAETAAVAAMALTLAFLGEMGPVPPR